MRLVVGDERNMVPLTPLPVVKDKPEPLGGNLSGWWSRRISQEHRLVYRLAGTGER